MTPWKRQILSDLSAGFQDEASQSIIVSRQSLYGFAGKWI
jgi:hypothetical protein